MFPVKYPYPPRFIELPNRVNMAYMDIGKGDKTLLFIHGLANYGPVWAKNMAELNNEFRCIAIDLPGNGLSDKHEHQFSMRFYAESIKDFIDKMALKQVCLVGHSMGGQIAMTLLLKYPDVAEKLVLCAPAGFEEFTPLDKAMYYSTMPLFSFISSDEFNLRSTVQQSFFRHAEQANAMIGELIQLMKDYPYGYYRAMIEASIRGMLEEPVYMRLDEIMQKTLVLFGYQDSMIPNKLLHRGTTADLAQQACTRFKEAQLILLSDCGHFIHWEKHMEVNRWISRFLTEQTT